MSDQKIQDAAPSELLPCPNPECGVDEGSKIEVGERYVGWVCECDTCGLRGPSEENKKEAIRAWNLLPRAPTQGGGEPEIFDTDPRLKEFGFIKGGYRWGNCFRCKKPLEWVKKRCWHCFECASELLREKISGKTIPALTDSVAQELPRTPDQLSALSENDFYTLRAYVIAEFMMREGKSGPNKLLAQGQAGAPGITELKNALDLFGNMVGDMSDDDGYAEACRALGLIRKVCALASTPPASPDRAEMGVWEYKAIRQFSPWCPPNTDRQPPNLDEITEAIKTAPETKDQLARIIAGGIKAARDDHPGLTDAQLTASIAKRIAGTLWGSRQDHSPRQYKLEPTPGSESLDLAPIEARQSVNVCPFCGKNILIRPEYWVCKNDDCGRWAPKGSAAGGGNARR